MRAWNGFGRSVVFAAAAAAALALAGALWVPPLAPRSLATLAACILAPLYLWGVAPTSRRGLVAAALSAAGTAALYALPLGPAGAALGAAAIVAAVRSGLLYRMRPWRAVVFETALAAGGLALARLFASGAHPSYALGAWGYFLVQSLFFAVAGVRAREGQPEVDPFDRARARLLELLD